MAATKAPRRNYPVAQVATVSLPVRLARHLRPTLFILIPIDTLSFLAISTTISHSAKPVRSSCTKSMELSTRLHLSLSRSSLETISNDGLKTLYIFWNLHNRMVLGLLLSVSV